MAANVTSTPTINNILLTAIGPIVGGIIALTGSILIFYFGNRAAQKRYEVQLDREDSKKARRQLDSLLNAKPDNIYEWSERITEFLSSFDGSFIPAKLRNKVKDEMFSIQMKLEEVQPGATLTPEEFQSIYEEQDALYEELSPQEEAQLELDEKVKKAKADLMKETRSIAFPEQRSSFIRRIRNRLRHPFEGRES